MATSILLLGPIFKESTSERMRHSFSSYLLVFLGLIVLQSACRSTNIAEVRQVAGDCLVTGQGNIFSDTLFVADDAPPYTLEYFQTPSLARVLAVQEQQLRLYRIDCTGNHIPELAKTWKYDNDIWTFTIDDSVAIATGTGWDDAIEQWNRANLTDAFDTIRVGATGELEVATSQESENPPWQFATERYAVHHGVSAGNTSQLHEEASGHSGIRHIRVRNVIGKDARSLLGDSIHVMFTTRMQIADYAIRRQGWSALPLPYNRAYVFISTTRAASTFVSAELVEVGTARFNDAVTTDASSDFGERLWTTMHCTSDDSSAISPAPELANQILFDSNDPVARQLAERIVALPNLQWADSSDAGIFVNAIPGLQNHSGVLRPVGVSSEEFQKEYRAGSSFGYILALPLQVPDPCDAINSLIAQANWLSHHNIRRAFVPLVKSRPFLLAGHIRPTIGLDYFGQPFLVDKNQVVE